MLKYIYILFGGGSMKKYAVIIHNDKLKYIYKKNLNSKEAVIELLNKRLYDKAFIYDSGASYIVEEYGDVLERLAIAAGFSIDSAKGYPYVIDSDVIYEDNKVLLWDKRDIRNNIMGALDPAYIHGAVALLKEGKLEFNEIIFKELLEGSLRNIDRIMEIKDLWLSFMSDLSLYVDYDFERNRDTYTFYDVYNFLFEKKMDLLDRIKYVIYLIEEYIKDKDKPLYARYVPDDVKKRILSILYDKKEPNEMDKRIFIQFMNDLADKDNPYGLWVKCYSHYGGNSYVPENYKISEECLLKLIDIEYNDNYPNTLGYIYYYGRVNNGIAEYDKAYKYYSLAALSGNVEARYKIGDMYRNGYYLKKNEQIAKSIYDSLYYDALKEFHKDPKTSSLADVSLRLAGFFDNEEEYKVGYMLYLQALLAINIRKGSFDSGVRRKIIKSIKEFYNKYKDKIESISLDEILDGYYDYKVSYKKGILHIYFEEKACFFDYKNCYAEYTDHVELKIIGSVLNKLNEKEPVSSIIKKNNVYTFLDEYGNSIGRIKIEDYKMLQNYMFMNNMNDDATYKIAVCQYEKGLGRKYHFLYEGDENIDKEWIITETNQRVYPIEFVELKGYELPCDIEYMKHIR